MAIEGISAAEAARQIRSGRLTSRALVKACLARVGERERDVGAWACLDAAGALDAARIADATRPAGPLHGVPVAFKDIIDTVDLPTALGSTIYEGRQPSWDAACVAACRAAGAIVIGKTVTTEFAYFHPGRTRNPRNLAHTPGGSSSGSAAAVADGMVPVALGTQTQGSVIRPAAFCGIVGYKPTFNDVSPSGVRAFSPSLDTIGVLCRAVEDAVLMRGVLLGGDAPTTLEAVSAPPRFAVCSTPPWGGVDDASRRCVEAAAERCRRAGARVDEATLPAEFAALLEDQRLVMLYEAARNFQFESRHFADRLSERLRSALEEGWTVSRTRYEQGCEALAKARTRFATLTNDHDAWLVPATVGEAPLASEGGTGDPLHNRLWTAMHGPALVLPADRGPLGLPLGVQLVAPPRRDVALLRAALWAERALRD